MQLRRVATASSASLSTLLSWGAWPIEKAMRCRALHPMASPHAGPYIPRPSFFLLTATRVGPRWGCRRRGRLSEGAHWDYTKEYAARSAPIVRRTVDMEAVQGSTGGT